MSPVLDLPIERLATSLAPLRGPRTDPASPLAPLPLRVAASGDGTYEVLDGFKRLAGWSRDGHRHVPVVVEDAPGVVRKARLLEANAPRRTLRRPRLPGPGGLPAAPGRAGRPARPHRPRGDCPC